VALDLSAKFAASRRRLWIKGAMLHGSRHVNCYPLATNPEDSMDLEKKNESARYASKLYQAVMSLKPGELCAVHQVHRMAKALALVEGMAARTHSPQEVLGVSRTH
jgi:hypothetical protein